VCHTCICQQAPCRGTQQPSPCQLQLHQSRPPSEGVALAQLQLAQCVLLCYGAHGGGCRRPKRGRAIRKRGGVAGDPSCGKKQTQLRGWHWRSCIGIVSIWPGLCFSACARGAGRGVFHNPQLPHPPPPSHQHADNRGAPLLLLLPPPLPGCSGHLGVEPSSTQLAHLLKEARAAGEFVQHPQLVLRYTQLAAERGIKGAAAALSLAYATGDYARGGGGGGKKPR
jgi:hypothetical protein